MAEEVQGRNQEFFLTYQNKGLDTFFKTYNKNNERKLPVPYVAAWQLSVEHKPQQLLSFGTSHSRQNYFQVLGLLGLGSLLYRVHDSAMDEPGEYQRGIDSC